MLSLKLYMEILDWSSINIYPYISYNLNNAFIKDVLPDPVLPITPIDSPPLISKLIFFNAYFPE